MTYASMMLFSEHVVRTGMRLAQMTFEDLVTSAFIQRTHYLRFMDNHVRLVLVRQMLQDLDARDHSDDFHYGKSGIVEFHLRLVAS